MSSTSGSSGSKPRSTVLRRRHLDGVVPCHRRAHGSRGRGDLAAAVRDAGHAGDGLRRGRAAGGARGAGRDRPRELERHSANAGGGDAGAGPVLRRVTHPSRTASPSGRGPGTPARHRPAADDRARRRRGRGDLRTAVRRGGPDPVDRAGADRRRARAGGRHRAARPGKDPPRAQRRERPQRRDLRAAAVRRRGGRRRRVRDLRGPRRGNPPARGDRLRRSSAACSAGCWSR